MPSPWAPGDREHIIRLVADQVTGRRIELPTPRLAERGVVARYLGRSLLTARYGPFSPWSAGRPRRQCEESKKTASIAKTRKQTMSQCHDLYEMPPYRPTTPEPVIVSQCHDLYLGDDGH